jgi:hypothetical protein
MKLSNWRLNAAAVGSASFERRVASASLMQSAVDRLTRSILEKMPPTPARGR